MDVRFCKDDLQTAQRQARLSLEFGRFPAFEKSRYNEFLAKDCFSAPVVVYLEQEVSAIGPFRTWAHAYDQNARETTEMTYGGTSYRVASRIELQEVRYYVGKVELEKDYWVRAYIEVPKEPALAKYLEHRQRAR
jgi:hypothetical protein